MSQKETLHFRLGENAGVLLQNIANEHLFCDMDPEKAIDTLVGSGCPEEYVLDILQNKLYLDTLNDYEMCIKTPDKISKKKLKLYNEYFPDFIDRTLHKGIIDKVEQGKDITKEMYRFFANHLLYIVDFDNAEKIFDMPDSWNWKASVEMSPLDIVKVWKHNDQKMMLLLEEGTITKCFNKRISDAFQDLEGLRQYVEEGLKLIKLNSWLIENLHHSTAQGWLEYCNQIDDLGRLLTLLQEMDDKSIQDWKRLHKDLETENNYSVDRAIIDRAVGSPMEEIEEFNNSHKKGRRLSDPVKWDQQWTAGFIDREGHIYGMMEHESRLAHLEIADAIYEDYPDTPMPEPNNRDWSLDRLGWVRFHDGGIRYSGYFLKQCGYAMRDLPFTSRQRDRLAEYAEKFYKNGLYNQGNGDSHTMITADMWRNMSEEELAEIFSF